MLHIKTTQNKSGAASQVGEKSAKTQNPLTSIITYSPSKFIVQASGSSNTKKHTQTHTQVPRTPQKIAGKVTTPSYYVVKAGSLGSAAAVSAATAAVAASGSPSAKLQPHAKAMVSATPPATTAASTATVASATTVVTATSTTAPIESSSTISVPSDSSAADRMEHSYMRDSVRTELSNGLAAARTILVRHAPQCPSCHTYPTHEQEPSETQQAHVPPYDEIAAKELMNECALIAKYVKNNNSDEQDWEARINQIGWTPMQKTLFDKVTRILDRDQLARLANDKRQHEAVHRRVSVDKSSSRLRRALASIGWEARTVQWLHTLLMEHLPPSYMGSYLDILQTLKTKLPTLTDKLLFSRPLNNSQELLAPVMKAQWEPAILPKSRLLTHNAIMVALPNMPTTSQVPERMQKWYKMLASITQIVQITLPNTNDRIGRQNLDQVAETIVSLTRVRIHELRTENPNRGIILIGFNAGAALALQVAMSESVACVVCMGFAYNTLRGPRGAPDDRLLDIKAPILFVVGQNSARTSQEEMEGLRERMQSESSLVVVGSADDSLRVPKSKRRIEGVTQTMVDAMVVDEIFEFVNKTLSNPPGPRMPTALTSSAYYNKQKLLDGNANKTAVQSRKRKSDGSEDCSGGVPAKIKNVPHIGRPRTRPLPNVTTGVSKVGNAPTNEELNMSIESILDDTLDYDDSTPSGCSVQKNIQSLPKPVTVGKPTVSLTPGTKIKMIPSQFVQLKTLPAQGKLVNYTINKTPGVGGATSIGSIVKTLPAAGPGQQIFTLKTPTGQTAQFVTAASSSAQQKYTVIKNANGTTTLQLAKNVVTPAANAAAGSGMDLSNIIDMPIVFADNEGNIAEQQQQQQQLPAPVKNVSSSSANVGQLIISQKIIKEANTNTSTARGPNLVGSGVSVAGKPIVLNKGLQQLFTTQSGNSSSSSAVSSPSVGNKVVYLNRNAIKPMGNVLTTRLPSGSVSANPLSPYAKIIVTNPKQPGSAATVANNQLLLDANSGALVSNVKTLNLQALNTPPTTPTSGTLRQTANVSVGNKTYPQFQVINSSGTLTTTAPTSVAAANISADGKQPMRNFYFKSATGLKQVQMLTQRPGSSTVNLTGAAGSVRRVVNIGPVTKVPTTTTTIQSLQEGQPKVIKLQTAASTQSKNRD